MAVREGELVFDFSRALRVEKLDKQARGVPSGAGASERHGKAFASKLRNDTLIHQNLVPKARDSYAFLHLMARDIKPFLYVVLLGMEQVRFDHHLLGSFKDRLFGRVRHEADVPWRRHYVTDCVVATVSDWTSAFPNYPLARVSES